ncbi:hypothetical protein V2J09_019838 [Rumex salicifolius]
MESVISSPTSEYSISRSSSSSPPPPPVPALVISPCAACKILRRRCVEGCVLAPYFPPTDPYKFTVAHRVFGASNIIKLLQELPEYQRRDTVSSMVYEANARMRDPVYGCAGAICHLQKQVNDLQAQLAKAQAELVNMHCQHAYLLALIYVEMGPIAQSPQTSPSPPPSPLSPVLDSDAAVGIPSSGNPSCFIDDTNLGSMWDPLWT